MEDVVSLFAPYRIEKGDTIVVGVSGGPDSMALLSMLLKYRDQKEIQIIAAHVDHNVRRTSAKEREFVESWCMKHNIFFETMTIDKYGDDNFENEARSIRYHFFEEVIHKYQAKILMTAHHGDDLMETILMRLTRGSTLKGYGGFAEVATMKDYQIIRPLLRYTKKDLEQYDKKHKIPYVIDKSNFKTIHTRNRYRKHLLPFFKKEDPNVHLKFLKFSKILNEYDNLIESQVHQLLSKVYHDNTLFIKKYQELEPIMQSRIIHTILESIYKDDLMLINDRHVELIQKLIQSRKSNSYIYLPNNIRAIKTYDQTKIVMSIDQVSGYEIELNDYVTLPNGHHLKRVTSCDTNGNDVARLNSADLALPLYVRTRRHGDKIAGFHMKGHSKVKDIFINHKVPLKDRELWPVVVDSKGEVVWIPGIKKSKFNKSQKENCDIIIKYY